MKKIEISLIVGFIISIFFINYTSFADNVEDIRDNVLRVHILANSNSNEDQNVKLKVRDRIVEETKYMFNGVISQQEAKNIAVNQLKYIEDIAQDEIYRNGYSYKVKAEIVNMFFTTRDYGNIVMPAGNYDAIRLKLGESVGDNWWCVLYPPMCIPASKNDEVLFNDVQVDILENSQNYKFRFAFLEIFEKIKNKFFRK